LRVAIKDAYVARAATISAGLHIGGPSDVYVGDEDGLFLAGSSDRLKRVRAPPRLTMLTRTIFDFAYKRLLVRSEA
jgi:hypothetical protein